MKFFNKKRDVEHSNSSTAVPSTANSVDNTAARQAVLGEKDLHNGNGSSANTKVPAITMRTIIMAILVAMGGFIFGYDTGQISGFLEMEVFLERFGQRTEVSEKYPYGYYFTNVRSGLIVALVSFINKHQPKVAAANFSSCLSVLSSDV
tara:strand:- start:75 stop:521 length:447 start_codon:yes stop_codon:yes gene_type:complete